MSLNPNLLMAAVATSLTLAVPSFAQTITGTDPVKIFILAGESNMNGKGTITPSTTPGTLDYVVANDPTGRYQFLKSGGTYVTRADVGIRGLGPAATPGNLTIGYGSNSALIGPELGFGHVIGDAFENKVLIIEVGVDGTTLGGSFCPPSSRVGEPEPVVATDKGFYYKEIIRLVNEAKASLGATPYEIAGLGWHQGWNDRNPTYSPLYEVNMANFINDIRSADKGIGVTNMPVVIASAAMDWNYGYSSVELAQLKMADATAYPAFAGNVAVVDTRQPYDGLEFWQPAHNSPANEGFHWNRSGKTFLHIGMAMGDAMTSLVPTRIPFRTRASGSPTGVTLTWNNGTETPTSVRVLRNGVEIAAAAPVNPPSFVDATAPLGVNNYELQFTMPVTPCPPLAISHNSGITNLNGGHRINGVRLTWDNNLGYTGITVKRNGLVIAASLPGSTNSYTDTSPLSGAVTYSVEPVDAGGTPVAIQVTVSAAPSGGALIYEPFDMTAGTTLIGKVGGIGLDGKWDGGVAIEVTSIGLYSFGSLPVFGNRLVRTTSNGSCAINIGDTLHEAGLMEHGSELWFSFLSQNPDNGNILPTLALGDEILSSSSTAPPVGNAIGARLQQGKNVQGIILKDGALAGNTPNQAVLGTSEVVLVVGRITWGANASAPDTIQIYTPGTDLVLDTPQSFSAVVDQSKFKVLSMWGNGATPNMDEIRFGDSYLDVIGQGADTSGDITPPTPSTMSFVTPPTAISTTSITMTATAASDTNGVQYLFDETSGNPGGTDSAWQDSPVYTDTGLNPDTQYTYTVQARDKSVNNNANTASSPASATTFPPDTNPPPTPGFSVAPNATSSTAITMTATTVTDAEGGAVEYFFDETSGNPGGTDSAWQSSPIYTDSGLSPSTQYTYTVKARDNASPPNESTASAAASATTPASPATGTQFWDGTGGDANWNTPENWGGDGLPAFSTAAINFGSLSSAAGTAFGNVIVPSQTTTNNNLTAGTLIKSINFGNTGVANRTDAYTLQGNSIVLGDVINNGIVTTALAGSAIVSSIQDVIGLNMDLGTAGTHRQIQTGAKHNLRIDGVISGGAAVGLLLRSTDSKITLTSANNSYSGFTNVAEGTGSTLGALLEITSIANGGSNSSIGASSNAAANLRFNSGFNDTSMTTLRYIGSVNASTDRLFTLYGNVAGTNSAIESSGAGTLSFANTGAIASGHAQGRNFYLGGTNTGDNTFAPSLSNFTTASTFTKQGVGKWILTGTHTYTGATTVSEGTLALGVSNCLPDTSNVLIGAGTLDVGAGFTDTLGTLDVTGTATINLGTGATLAFAASNGINSGTWVGTLNITGTLGATSIRFGTSNTALTAGQLAKITVNGSGPCTLDSNGYLIAASVASAYDSWADAKGLTGLPGSSTDPAKDADPDNDGRNNLGEFAFNGDPLSGSDNGKIFALTEDSDFDGDATKELVLTVAVRSGTPAFSGSPLSAIQASDAITYSIEGSLDLASFPTAVNVVPTPLTSGLPAAGEGYEYRSFSLSGSNGLTGKGFLRAKVTSP